MASQIEVRDLEARASAIVQEVHEQEAEFIVTLRGEPVAMLLPLHERDDRDLELEESLEQADRLAERIALGWQSPKSALELLDEQRR